MYKTNHSAVFDGTAENFYEFAMAYGVEEAFKVRNILDLILLRLIV